MIKQALSETSPEFAELKEKWFDKARKIESFPELEEFYNYLFGSYYHDYGTMIHAISAFAVAAANLTAHEQGITGFQAGCVMWDFIKYWNHQYNKCGLRLVDYDNMLYPQYAYRFDKTITPYTWKKLQTQAAQKLAKDSDFAHPDVVKHWTSIVNGEVPFGYKIKED